MQGWKVLTFRDCFWCTQTFVPNSAELLMDIPDCDGPMQVLYGNITLVVVIGMRCKATFNAVRSGKVHDRLWLYNDAKF